jgi:glycosyltransferase involved in cell wall biosynthesis
MLSVVHVIDTGGPGGAETVFLHCATRLDPSRFTCTAVIDNDNWLAEQIRASGNEPLIVPARGSFNFKYLRRIAEIAHHAKAHLICAHLYGSAVYASGVGVLNRIPVISVFHGGVDVASRNRFGALKAAIVRRGSRKVVFVSRNLRTELNRVLRIPDARSTVIPNGIDTTVFSPGRDHSIRSELGLPSDSILVGAVGNIRPAKAYDVFLRAARRLADRSDRFYFAIAGQNRGALADELMRLRSELKLDRRVFFLGLRANVATVMRNLDVFALSSRSEGFSIACVEAMACGIPVVATRCGGPEEILDSESGILVARENPDELAEAIGRLAEDPKTAHLMTFAAMERARREFSLETMVARYEALFENVIRARERGGSNL